MTTLREFMRYLLTPTPPRGTLANQPQETQMPDAVQPQDQPQDQPTAEAPTLAEQAPAIEQAANNGDPVVQAVVQAEEDTTKDFGGATRLTLRNAGGSESVTVYAPNSWDRAMLNDAVNRLIQANFTNWQLGSVDITAPGDDSNHVGTGHDAVLMVIRWMQ